MVHFLASMSTVHMSTRMYFTMYPYVCIVYMHIYTLHTHIHTYAAVIRPSSVPGTSHLHAQRRGEASGLQM